MPLKNRFPVRGYVGIVLVAVFWYLNWNLSGLRTHWGFFPLWLGYCLTIDAITYYKKGNSLVSRNLKGYISLFLVSAPSWWLFELLNKPGNYWSYTAREHFSDLEYFLLASISFSTVIPAVFGTSEWVGTFSKIQNMPAWLKIGSKRHEVVLFFILGVLMLFVVLFLPDYGAPFLWMSVFLIIDPLNVWLGNRSILQETGNGNWKPVITLWAGCLICGFFWEMWNYHSNPKWIYDVPGVNFWHVFEMPAPGYLGYLPFSLELFALYHFITGIFKQNKLTNYLRL
ncbi:MAG: hypothetical protein IH947_08775 [Bacteroidetes bacterium]|nr:hypothetical protein [Bacteroidota bacterium]